MDCPVCKKPMIVVELDQVETDYCPDCGGIWLDAGELEILLDDAQAARQVIGSFQPAQTSETTRKCPICYKKMEKVLVGVEPTPVMIDRCTKQHGLWFDRGELTDVLRCGRFDPAGKVAKILNELYQPAQNSYG